MLQPIRDRKPFSPEPRLWTVPQTATALGVSGRSVYRLIGLGKLDIKKIGRSTRVIASSVDRFVNGGAAK